MIVALLASEGTSPDRKKVRGEQAEQADDDVDPHRVFATKETQQQAEARRRIEAILATPVASGTHAVGGHCASDCPLPVIVLKDEEDTISFPLTSVRHASTKRHVAQSLSLARLKQSSQLAGSCGQVRHSV